MSRKFQKYFFNAQIRLLQAVSPATLFHKISLLDWYSDTLQNWIDLHISDAKLRVLDLGCATGYLSEYIHQKGCDVSGVDISDSMIRAAKMSVEAAEQLLQSSGLDSSETKVYLDGMVATVSAKKP